MGRALVAGFVCTLVLACGSDSVDTPLEVRDQSIIRGTLVQSEELDHTGALVVVDPETKQRSLFCTATLIAPETVVTAKHCALTILEAESVGLPVEWLAGPSVAEPIEQIPVAAVAFAPGNQGGFLGIGRDVAVAHLDHPASVAFVEPALLTDEQVGQEMLSIGYGIFTPNGAQDGRRRVGSEAVAAIRGRAYEAMFGGFENFLEWAFTGDVTSANFLQSVAPGDRLFALALPGLRQDYESTQLLDGYEAVTGRVLGDTQTCSGDSGGPLAQRDADGTWRTYGVVSGGLDSARSVCDYGSVFAVFGPETLTFLDDARAWADPCAEVSVLGECQGQRAVRCQTSLLDELRRPIQRDCAAAGLACFLGPNGADCIAPPPNLPLPSANAATPADAGVGTAD
ncbi:MAG: hypothetical protein RL033_2448 [Pseudomonadota bacterium]|jgi:hypothetical protein